MDKMREKVLCGFAEADITPLIPASCELVGFNRFDETARGILHRLKSQILILKSARENSCLITIDSIGFTTELTELLRDGVADKLKTERQKVMVCFSHTHSAPNAAANDNAYFRFVNDKILGMVDEAYGDLTPVKAAWGIAENKIGINRRAGVDTMDNCMGVLKIADEISNRTKILLLHVTAHANVLTSDNYLISADYFGVARELLEKEYSCKAMLVQGAAGNVKPRYRQHNADFLEIHPLEAAEIKMDEKETRKIFEESMMSLDNMAGKYLHP
ncbi:hypothetical protein [Aminipila terrae]|uniref:hypothetical protein n=1 Tax=Aminipila terrae TaxID=2697030 RepID=UPI001FAD30A3|nr:hypothetical protein [Aminipila terrae]